MSCGGPPGERSGAGRISGLYRLSMKRGPGARAPGGGCVPCRPPSHKPHSQQTDLPRRPAPREESARRMRRRGGGGGAIPEVQGRRPGSSGLWLSSFDKNPFAHADVRRSPTQRTRGRTRVTHLRGHPCGASAPASRRHRRHHRIATAITDSNRRLRVLRRRAVILKSEDSHRRAMW